jgi:hypothetical protein
MVSWFDSSRFLFELGRETLAWVHVFKVAWRPVPAQVPARQPPPPLRGHQDRLTSMTMTLQVAARPSSSGSAGRYRGNLEPLTASGVRKRCWLGWVGLGQDLKRPLQPGWVGKQKQLTVRKEH